MWRSPSAPSLLGRRCLDPACGSGIFLVGLFNRMAEEWKQANTEARNDRRARELRKVLCSLYGVDINPTACRITAFSLYLAYLDQLSPRDIQELQQKGHKLPRLVHYPETTSNRKD
jgi:type I restriction-modification system DNA methylase subunit